MPNIVNNRHEVGTSNQGEVVYASGRPCTGCRETGREHRIIDSSTRGARMHTLCVTCERSRAAARRASTTAAPPVTAGSPLGARRKFGVEIECNIPGGHDGAAARRLRELIPTGWRVKGDGSLNSSTGVELVGPPLTGEDGLNQVRQVCEALATVGATVDRRCGLHVHHDVRDIGREGLVHFTRSWAANQNLLDWLVSPSRRSAAAPYYCRAWTESQLRSLRADRLTVGERYKTVNLHSFSKFGTVEIRQHQGTLSFRKIEAWIKIAQAMLDAVASAARALGAHGSLRELFATLGTSLDEDTGAFLMGRALQFGAPGSTVAA